MQNGEVTLVVMEIKSEEEQTNTQALLKRLERMALRQYRQVICGVNRIIHEAAAV